MKVTVSQKHLDQAQAAQNSYPYEVCRQCLLAVALNDIPGVTNAEAAYTYCDFTYEGQHVEKPLPQVGKELVKAFDARDTAKLSSLIPVTFELDE